jgi:hypothetical protein
VHWIFTLLLLANAAFFFWQWREPVTLPSPMSEVTYSDRVNRLLLLSEVGYDELNVRKPLNPGATQPSSNSSERSKTGSIAESTSSSRSAGADVAKPSGPRDVCYSVGPLSDELEVSRVREWLESRGGRARLRLDERRELSLYWVYLEPLASRELAVQRVEEMRAKGIDDIFAILRGDMGNAISLGVYSRRSSLERRMAELKAKGYDASVVPRYRTKKATWFDVAFDPGFEFPGERFALAFPTVEAVDANCDGSSKANPALAQASR